MTVKYALPGNVMKTDALVAPGMSFCVGVTVRDHVSMQYSTQTWEMRLSDSDSQYSGPSGGVMLGCGTTPRAPQLL